VFPTRCEILITADGSLRSPRALTAASHPSRLGVPSLTDLGNPRSLLYLLLRALYTQLGVIKIH